MKFQAPNTKSQINTKFQVPNPKSLEFDYWNLFGAWDLIIGIYLMR